MELLRQNCTGLVDDYSMHSRCRVPSGHVLMASVLLNLTHSGHRWVPSARVRKLTRPATVFEKLVSRNMNAALCEALHTFSASGRVYSSRDATALPQSASVVENRVPRLRRADKTKIQITGAPASLALRIGRTQSNA